MLQRFLKRVRRGTIAAVAATLMVGSGGGHAAEFIVNWDPIFNPTVSGLVGFQLGWRGSASVTVDPGCLLAAGTYTIPSGGCPSATVNSFNLEFYDNAFPLVPIASYTVGAIPAITDVLVNGSLAVAGINLAGTGIDIAGATFTFGSFTVEDLDLDFSIAPFLGPTLAMYDADTFTTYGSATVGPNAPIAVWTLVPEPTSLALAGLALAGLALRRRKA